MGLAPESLEAYCLDEVVASFGNFVSNEIQNVKGKTEKSINAKRARLLEKLLADESGESTKKVRFADPADMLK